MLQAIRDHAQGWIAWVIVGLIILTFALFGIDQYARGDKTTTVAEVNGEGVTATDFLTLYNREKMRLQKQFGDMYESIVKDEELRSQVLNALIESKLISQWNQEHNLLISDQQLAATIQSAQVFQDKGEFSQKLYEEILARNGLNVARFEYEQREFLAENQFRSLTLSSAFSTNSETEQLAQLQGQQRQINYLRIDQRPFLEKVTVDEAEIAAEYEKSKSDWLEPEKVQMQYVELSQAQLAQDIEVNDALLKAFYQDNQSLFTLPEKRHAKHILVRMDADTPEAEEKAKRTLAEIEDKLKKGESFEELAKIYSQDPGSASSGGDLGEFEQGMMVPAFDQAVFSMQSGEISKPVKTEFGYHLIKLESIVSKTLPEFAEIKEDVEKQYKKQQAEKQYFDKLEQLNTVAYEQPENLQAVADAVGLPLKTTEAFGRHGGTSEVTSNPKFIQAAFSDDVMKNNLNSTAIELGNNQAVVIHLDQHFPERQKTLQEVSEQIKQELTRAKAVAEAGKLAQSLLPKVQAGENPESLMSSGVEWHPIGWIERNSQRLLPQMVSEVFKIQKPQTGASVWHSYQLPTGDTVLIELSGVKTESVGEEQKVSLQKAFTELSSNAELDARLKALMAKAEIVRKPVYETIK
ncbi:SurA N-terminal domain-containing protein [Thiomicrorhabdus sp.]|uniref:SurA N-terminal domain-containing protein n=1 Tax=Thiomicrorhabdus sp. TaxID=2039724 RepID=UPI0029C74755|nr:SurA N-terminal domain-containing protein [Thiomicrorhabdus sp.]